MSKKIVPMIDPEREASARFTEYVQSVAFHLTLSRGMIAVLESLREGENPCGKYSCFISHSRSLINRGLVVWVDGKINPKTGCYFPDEEPYFRLTRIGELMVGLLVECGMMAKNPTHKRTEKRI